jgi:hypothetical protein
MAKKSKTRVIGRGVNAVNLPKENEQYAAANQAALNTQLINNSQQNNGVYGSQYTTTGPTGTAQVTQTQNPLTGNTTTTQKTYNSNYQASPLTDNYKEKMLNSETFSPSPLTNEYRDYMRDIEDDRPAAYQSKYEATIDEILNTIKNRQAFDVNNDANYQALYDQYAERYKANAERAMNDAMASANAATGGYGSTYGQVAGQQAYDRTMEGLNDQNMALMQLAYQIYEGDRANDYNMLGAYQGQDNTLYSRYRDDVNDWYNDRAYYANQYQQNYANDRNAFENDRSYNAGQYWNSYNSDYTVSQDEIKRDDANYQDALSQAMALAKEGLPVPSYITDRINQYNAKYGLSGDATAALAELAAVAAAGSGGSGGGGNRRGPGKTKETANNEIDDTPGVIKDSDVQDIYNRLKNRNSGTYADRYPEDDYLQNTIENNYIDFKPSLTPIQDSIVNDTLNEIALDNLMKGKAAGVKTTKNATTKNNWKKNKNGYWVRA